VALDEIKGNQTEGDKGPTNSRNRFQRKKTITCYRVKTWRNDAPKDECKVQLEGKRKSDGQTRTWAICELTGFPGMSRYQTAQKVRTVLEQDLSDWIAQSVGVSVSDERRKVQLGESGDGSIHSDPSTHPRPRGLNYSNTQRSSLPSGGQTGVGQGGKTSLSNTADEDILEYILTKLAARIAAKSKTFLVID
jgi:hypothetical protein